MNLSSKPVGQELMTVPTRSTGPLSVEPESPILMEIEQTLETIAESTRQAIDEMPVGKFDLTIIVPVYNERDTLPCVLDRIEAVMPATAEVIVVDDGSVDGTSEWLQQLPTSSKRRVIRRRRNHGKGSCVRLAIRHSQGRVVAIQDADLEYDPADLLRVASPILEGKADVVYGSRYLGTTSDRSRLHRLGNQVLTFLSNRLTGLQLTDMETCHKAFNGNLIRDITLRECRFGFEPEITGKIAARGIHISEVPVGYQQRGFDEGKKIGWRDGVAALACLWKYRV